MGRLEGEGAGEGFCVAELYNNERVLEEVIRFAAILKNRADVNLDTLHRLSRVLNHQGFRIFLFIMENGPVTDKQLQLFFPRKTLGYWLQPLEAERVIVKRSYRWRIHY